MQDLIANMTAKEVREVKRFLDVNRNTSHWEDLVSDPTMTIVSFEKNDHLVLGEDGGKIRVFVSGRYSMVYSTFAEWERLTIDRTKNDAAFHIWMTA